MVLRLRDINVTMLITRAHCTVNIYRFKTKPEKYVDLGLTEVNSYIDANLQHLGS